MKKLLITGFEPFGGEEINPSWEAVKLLSDEVGEYCLKKLLIPVVFGDAADMVIRRAEEYCPDVILCIGQAGGRSAITPEAVALNLRYAKIPDNKGNEPKDEPVVCGGDAAYFATVNLRGMSEAAKAAGIPIEVSYSAGTYVCNDLYYRLLSRFDKSVTKVGFIHIPYCTDQNKEPSMDIAEIVKGLTILIQNVN